mmetsp:Transcript_39419/g.73072  ORF Transcript_39419/g.73072 Transcript_39419/m.73072 type:complete len:855 (-) Transcript_39419:88-2652(-)
MMEWQSIPLWPPNLYLHAETLRALSWITDADSHLRCGKYSEAKTLAAEALQSMNLLLLRTRWLRWLAENLEKEESGSKAKCICSSPVSIGKALPEAEAERSLQDDNEAKVELAGILAEPCLVYEAEEDIPEYIEYVPNLELPGAHEESEEEEDKEEDNEEEESTISEPLLPSTLVCKRALGRLAGTDAGSGALLNLKYYEAQEDGWMMFGHAVGQDVVLVKEQPFVRRATKWTRCWIDAGSAKPKDHAIYIPGCDDPEFVACGVVFVFGGDNWEKPRDDVPVAVVHKSLLLPSTLGEDIWSDVGVGSACSVKLNLVPELNTAWPSVATLMGRPPPMATPKVVLMGEPSDVSVVSETCCPNQLVVRNTFIDFPRSLDPSLVGFYKVRRTRSAPCSPVVEVDAETAGQFEFDYCGLAEMVAAASAALGRTESPALETSSGPYKSLKYFPFETYPAWPREILFRFLHARDICRLACACRLLSRWPKTRFWCTDAASASQSFRTTPDHIAHSATRSPQTHIASPPSPAPSVPVEACASYDSARDSRHVRRPCDVILEYLSPVEVCRLRAACHKLLRWSQTGLVMMVTPSWKAMALQESASIAAPAPHSPLPIVHAEQQFVSCSPTAALQGMPALQDASPISALGSPSPTKAPLYGEAHRGEPANGSLAYALQRMQRLPAESYQAESTVPNTHDWLQAALQREARHVELASCSSAPPASQRADSQDAPYLSMPEPHSPVHAAIRREAQHVELASCIEPPMLTTTQSAGSFASPVMKPPGLEQQLGKHLRLAELTDMSSSQRRASGKQMLRRDRKMERRHNAEELKHALRASAPRHFVFPHLQNEWPPACPPGLENMRRP